MKGLTLYQSNRLEALADRLAKELSENRKENFSLRPDTVLVNNYEMAQWLAIRIAERQGVCANVDFRLIGSYVYELSGWIETRRQPVMQDETIGRARLRWLIFSVLSHPESGLESGQAAITGKAYGLENILEPARRAGPAGLYELSGQIADVFDKYMNFRYDMLQEWEQHTDTASLEDADARWQAALWNLLCERAGERFKAGHLVKLAEGLSGVGSAQDARGIQEMPGLDDILKNLPPAIYIFGISYLPPLHQDIIKALSNCSHVQLYHLAPCREYWTDIVPERKRIRLERKYDMETIDSLFPAGNRLLAALGLAGRQFLARFHELDFSSGRDLSEKAQGNSMLSAVQHSVLQMKELEEVVQGQEKGACLPDGSIEFHSCHNRLREVEVLHDRLINAFLEDSSLEPHHVAVMAPDISLYSDAIEAVFGQAPEERQIPYSIGDIGFDKSSPAVNAFISLLNAAAGEFTAPDLMDLLAEPMIARRFGLDNESLYTMRQLVKQAGIRRGMDTLSPGSNCTTNTWLFGLDRLMVTGLMDTEGAAELPGGYRVRPLDCSIEGERLNQLSALSSFVFGLERLSSRLLVDKTPHVTDYWRPVLRDAIIEFIMPEDEWDRDITENLVIPLEKLFEDMEAGGLEHIPFRALSAAIQDHFSTPSANSTFISGRVLFSSLVPLRALPFRVICLMGMNQGEFPRQAARPSYDLMAKNPRAGDRIRREEDRYLFLETIMSARERLVITFVGRRQSDNERLEPSTVVSELVKTVAQGLAPDDTSKARAISRDIITEHPLQPFGEAYLKDNSGRLLSYATEWLPVDSNGRRLETRRVEPVAEWPSDFSTLLERPEEPEWQVSAESLVFFLSNPVRHFLRTLLSIEVNIGEEALGDHETYRLDYHEEKEVLTEILLQLSGGREPGDAFFKRLYNRLVLGGVLPDNALGDAAWQWRMENRFLPLADQLNSLSQKVYPAGDAEVDFSIDLGLSPPARMLISGSAGIRTRDEGIMELQPAMSERSKILLWLRHVIWCASGTATDPGKAFLITRKGESARLAALPEAHATAYAMRIAKLYKQAMTGLIPFWPAASYAFAKALQSKPRKKDFKTWNPVSLRECDSLAIAEAEAASLNATKDSKFRSSYRDPWLMYLSRGNHRPPDSLVKDAEFQETSLDICAPMFWAMEKGR